MASAPAASSFLRRSVWVPAFPPATYPKLCDKGKKYDAAVVGAGMFGVNVAHRLAKAGKSVALIEARRIASGTTGGSTAKLSSQHNLIYHKMAEKHSSDVAFNFGKMQEDAIGEVEKLVEFMNIDCAFRRAPHYVWTSSEKMIPAMEAEVKECQKHGWKTTLCKSNFDPILPSSVGLKAYIKFENQALFDPYAFCHALTKDVGQMPGCEVFEETRITNVKEAFLPTGEHSIQASDGAEISAANVILATHLPILDRSGHFAVLQPSRSHCILVRTKEPINLDMCISCDDPFRSLRVVGPEKKMMIVCGEAMEPGAESNTIDRYEKLEEFAKKHFDVERVLRRWSEMDYMSGEYLPYIGLLHSGTNSVYTATGFSKWGLASSMAAAQIVTDLINGVHNRFAHMVDARRWHLLKIAKTAFEESKNVTQHFAGDKWAAATTSSSAKPSDLERGAGGFFKAEHHGTVGTYRDMDGALHSIKPVCTHLGCNLLFNAGDLCWDCPCHGSRFDVDGSVLHGPACAPLEKLDIKW